MASDYFFEMVNSMLNNILKRIKRLQKRTYAYSDIYVQGDEAYEMRKNKESKTDMNTEKKN